MTYVALTLCYKLRGSYISDIYWQVTSVKRRKVGDNAAAPLSVILADTADLRSSHVADDDDDDDDDLCSEMTDASQVTSPYSLI